MQGKLLSKVTGLGLTLESPEQVEILTKETLKTALIEMERHHPLNPMKGQFRLRTAPG